MPRVPTYGGPQLRTDPLQPAYQNNIDVSSGVQAVARGIGQVGEVVDRIQMRDAETEAWKAQAEINDRFRAWRDKATTELQGDKAKGFTALADGWWADTRREFEGKLSPRARDIIGKSLATVRDSALNSATAFESQQLEIANTAAFNENVSRLSGAAAAAGAGRADPLIAQITSAIQERGRAKGIPVDSIVLATTSGVHEQIIRQMLTGPGADPAKAGQYLSERAAKGEIDPKRMGEIEKAVQIGARQQTAQTFADGAMAQGMGFAEALAAARKTYSGDEEVAVTNELKTRFSEVDAVKARQAKETYDTALSQVLARGSLARVDPNVMEALSRASPEGEQRLRDWVDAKRRQAKAEAEGTQDPDEYGRFYTYFRMASENRSAFASLNLADVQPYVSKQHLAQLTAMQAGVSKADAKAMDQQRQIKATVDMVKGTILQAGIDLSPKEGSPQATEFNNFMGALAQTLNERQAAQPDKPLTPDQLRQAGMDMLRQGYEQGSGLFGFGQTVRRGYQIATDPALAGRTFISTPYDQIPETIRADLERDYDKKFGRGGSIYGNAGDRARAVERAYQLGLEQGRFK